MCITMFVCDACSILLNLQRDFVILLYSYVWKQHRLAPPGAEGVMHLAPRVKPEKTQSVKGFEPTACWITNPPFLPPTPIKQAEPLPSPAGVCS